MCKFIAKLQPIKSGYFRERKDSMVRYAKWQRILQQNQDKLKRFFGERTKRSIDFDHKGPIFLTQVQTQMKQTELEMISPPDYTYCIILLIINFLLLLNFLRIQNCLCQSKPCFNLIKSCN